MRFVIEGKPFGWQRCGENHQTGVSYKQDETRSYQQLAVVAYKSQARGFRFPPGTALALRVVAFYPIAQSVAKEKRAKMLSGEIRPTVKPDWDNVGKIISDALNGIAYDDDKSIADAMVRKFYSDRPRVEVSLEEAKGPSA